MGSTLQTVAQWAILIIQPALGIVSVFYFFNKKTGDSFLLMLGFLLIGSVSVVCIIDEILVYNEIGAHIEKIEDENDIMITFEHHEYFADIGNALYVGGLLCLFLAMTAMTLERMRLRGEGRSGDTTVD